MKKLKLLCLCLIITFVVFKINSLTAIRSASAQEVPNFDEVTAVDEIDAESVKYSRPTDDTRVTESDPRVNYGKSKYLAAGRWKKGKVESYIKFDVRKGYRADKLYIYLISGKTSGLTVYSASRNWSERKIIWKNRPSKGSKLDSSANKSGSWWEFDVSSARSSNGEYAFTVTGPSNKIVNFYSKEGKRAPRLSYIKGQERTPSPTNKTTSPTSTTNATSTVHPSSTATNNPTSSPTNNPTVEPTNTNQPTFAPSPSCDPGIDCGNDGDPATGGVVIDETDDGEGTGATATPAVTPSCAPGIDCNNDGGTSATPAPTTGPTCPPGLDCNPDGPLPSSSSPSATCVPGIDCTNDGGSPTASPTTGSRSSTPTSTATAAPSTPGGGTGGISAAPNTKIAYIGDTGDGNNFQAVLNLIKQEGATAVVHSGDLSYTSSASTFIGKINATLGANFPYFMGQGNHDKGTWGQYVPRIPSQYVVAGSPASADYAVNFQGVYVAIGRDKVSTPSTFSTDLKLAQVQNIWKVCSFHEVHRAMHTGYKSTEIPYSVYDECRTYGAMTTNGHAHTYNRSVTLLSASGQQIDPSYPDPFNLRVARGVFFDLHNGASGKSPGSWERCKKTTDASDVAGGKCNIFANRNGAVITRIGSPYGAAFITYNVDGDPRKARGYYMETNSTTHIDDWTVTAQ